MSNKDTKAFPTQTFEYDGLSRVLQYQEDGMSLRDYFAAKAMQSVLGSLNGTLVCEEIKGDWLRYSNTAYAIADAIKAILRKASER